MKTDSILFNRGDFITWMTSEIAVYVHEEYMSATFVIVCFITPKILQPMKFLLYTQMIKITELELQSRKGA
jgi:hypothetical protein